MMRVSQFLQQDTFNIEPYSQQPSTEELYVLHNYQLSVVPGASCHNTAIVSLHVPKLTTLTFHIVDLHQTQSPLIKSIQSSITVNPENEGYDYWHSIPPVGVVEVHSMMFDHVRPLTLPERKDILWISNTLWSRYFQMIVVNDLDMLLLEPILKERPPHYGTLMHEGARYHRFCTSY